MAAAFMAIGGIVSAIGSMKQAKASAKAEKLRERQMRLEAMRKRRELIREGQVARAEALSNATSQGAASSTGLFGGYGQITGTTNRNVLATNQDEEISGKIFKANRQYASAGGLVAIGQGISSFGSAFS